MSEVPKCFERAECALKNIVTNAVNKEALSDSVRAKVVSTKSKIVHKNEG